jgi:hypothetical protein
VISGPVESQCERLAEAVVQAAVGSSRLRVSFGELLTFSSFTKNEDRALTADAKQFNSMTSALTEGLMAAHGATGASSVALVISAIGRWRARFNGRHAAQCSRGLAKGEAQSNFWAPTGERGHSTK